MTSGDHESNGHSSQGEKNPTGWLGDDRPVRRSINRTTDRRVSQGQVHWEGVFLRPAPSGEKQGCEAENRADNAIRGNCHEEGGVLPGRPGPKI